MARSETKYTLDEELDLHVRKFPVDTRGYHVLPCVMLLPENMETWMVGLSITFSLRLAPSSQGTLEKWDDKWLYIKTGASVKKMAYDPEDIQLGVIQFKQGIVFSNTMLPTHQQKDSTDDVEEEKQEEIAPVPVKTKPRKKKPSPKQTTSYVPKHSIVWS